MDDPLAPILEQRTTAYNLEVERLFPGGRAELLELALRKRPFFTLKRDLTDGAMLTPVECAKVEKNLVMKASGSPGELRTLYECTRWIGKQAWNPEQGSFDRERALAYVEQRFNEHLQHMPADKRAALLPELEQLLAIDLKITDLRAQFCLGRRTRFQPMDVTVVPKLIELVRAATARPAPESAPASDTHAPRTI